MRSFVYKVLVAVVVVMTLSACSLTYYRHTSNADYQTIDGNDVSVSMSLHGEMRVNEEETEIEYLAPGSKIKITSKGIGEKRHAVLRGVTGGELDITYQIDGKNTPFDAIAKQWVATVIPVLYSQSGVQIPSRVEKLYRKGGEDLVLDRTAAIRSDHSQANYLSYFFQNKLLSDKGVGRSIVFLTNIQSDIEQSKVMKALVTTQEMSEQRWIELLRASQTVQSDIEMRKFFSFLQNAELPLNAVSEITRVSAGYIQSDSEQAKVLKAFAKNGHYDDQRWLDLLDSSKSIQSDSELSKVLVQVLDNQLDDAVLMEVIDITRFHIGSSSSKGEVFTHLINNAVVTPAVKRALLNAIEDIGSSSEQAKLYKLLVA